jgi:ribosome biogenesis protein Tsr3
MRAAIIVACNPISYGEQLKLFIVPTAICCGIRLHVSTAFDFLFRLAGTMSIPSLG